MIIRLPPATCLSFPSGEMDVSAPLSARRETKYTWLFRCRKSEGEAFRSERGCGRRAGQNPSQRLGHQGLPEKCPRPESSHPNEETLGMTQTLCGRPTQPL